MEETAISEIKRGVHLREWTEQIKSQQESGMTVRAYCEANGINMKTYYYHLRKVREQYAESAPAIVPVTMLKTGSGINIEKNGLHISLSSDVTSETLLAIIHELC